MIFNDGHGRSLAIGFTLIELMIVVAIVAIILTLAVPVYSNYTIRTKIGEALSVAAAAKTSVVSACHEDITRTGLTNLSTGYSFEPSTWIGSLEISGDCNAPLITITTRDTGAPIDTILFLKGSFVDGSGSITWTCTTDAAHYLAPQSATVEHRVATFIPARAHNTGNLSRT